MNKAVTLTFFSALLITVALAPTLASYAEKAEDSWTTLTQIPTGRTDLGVAVVDGKIYAIGGRDDRWSLLGTNEMYDPETGNWTSKAPMPTPRAAFAVATYQNKIYVIGGSPSKGTFSAFNQVYDPLTDTWETKTPMPTPRNGLCASVVKGKIYLIGGGQEYPYPNWGPSSENEVYDPETDTWTIRTSLPEHVYLAASVVLDGKIHVLGGQYEFLGGGYGNFHQVYDTENDTWTEAKPVPNGFHSAAAGVTTGVFAPKRIYVLGGFSSYDYEGPCNLTQVYDPDQDSWSFGAPMPTPRGGFGVAVIDDELYAIGGWKGFFPPSVANERYTPIGYSTAPQDISEERDNSEPFSTLFIIAFGAGVAVVGLGLLVYFKKRNH